MRTTLLVPVVLLLVACSNRGTSKSGNQLLDPARLNVQAPPTFSVAFSTSKGDFVVQVQREWAPAGADRFYNLVRAGFFDGVRFFRTVKGFMVQFGINGQPAISKRWVEATIPDDPVEQANLRGFVTFATSGRDSRTTQISSTWSTTSASTPAASLPSARWSRAWRWSTASTPATARARPAGRAPTRSGLRPKATPTSSAASPPSTP